MRSRAIVAIAVLALAGSGGTAAFAASNPLGTGQPGAPTTACGSVTSGPNGPIDATSQPPGLTGSGFLHATTVYAGSTGTPSANNANSTHAISQYDVACYQFTSSGH